MMTYTFKYTINGAKFRNSRSFYNVVEQTFGTGPGAKMNRNLDVFAELLEGGFDKHAQDEPIHLKWINFKMSEERLDAKFLAAIVEIIEAAENVTFERQSLK